VRSRKARTVKAVIYISGTPEEMLKQLDWCTDLCDRRHYKIVGVARDRGDGVAWVDAQLLVRSGIADRIIVYSGDLVPAPEVESATGEIPGVPGARDRRPARYRRIRPIKRNGAAGA
jgi:hypothetical protein